MNAIDQLAASAIHALDSAAAILPAAIAFLHDYGMLVVFTVLVLAVCLKSFANDTRNI